MAGGRGSAAGRYVWVASVDCAQEGNTNKKTVAFWKRSVMNFSKLGIREGSSSCVTHLNLLVTHCQTLRTWCFPLFSLRGCSVTCWYCLCLYLGMNRFALLDLFPAKTKSGLSYVKWKGCKRLLYFYFFDNQKSLKQMEVLIGATEINCRAPTVNHQEPLPAAKILCHEDFVAL